jgi:hypothetical protein
MRWPLRDGDASAPTKVRALLLLALFALPIAGIGIAWLASAQHALAPGYTGCSYVRDRDAQISCYSRVMQSAVDRDGLKRALADVDRRARTSTTLAADCHLAWHPIGERAGRAAAKHGAAVSYPSSPTTCQRGFAHGMVIGHLTSGEVNTPADATRALERMCLPINDTMTAVNCTHAVGHVIARLTDGNQEAGVRACGAARYSRSTIHPRSTLPVGAQVDVAAGLEFQCLYGMYMEAGIRDVARGDTRHDACGSAPRGLAQSACYSYLPTRVGAIEGDLEHAARACNEDVPAGQMRDKCISYLSFGFDSPARCTLFPAAAERQRCREVVASRLGTDAPRQADSSGDRPPMRPDSAPNFRP